MVFPDFFGEIARVQHAKFCILQKYGKRYFITESLNQNLGEYIEF